MILISSALPKSASTLIADYQEELLKVAGRRSGQAKLHEIFNGRYIDRLGPLEVVRLIYLGARYGSLVVKTHSSPQPLVRALVLLGLAKATVCYRDPRDVVLSVIDHTERSRKGLAPPAFTGFEDVEGSIPRVRSWLTLVDRWERFGRAHFIRYEDLMEDHGRELRKMVEYLGWDISESELEEVVRKKESGKATSWNFNAGRSQRYLSEMAPSEIEAATRAFERFLTDHGYDTGGD